MNTKAGPNRSRLFTRHTYRVKYIVDSKYQHMDIDELKNELNMARQRLQDVEETFNFTLANTNTHLADAMVLDFEQELYDSRDLVAELEAIIKNKSPE